MAATEADVADGQVNKEKWRSSGITKESLVPKGVGGYVVSISNRIRRLHLIGACWMTPGVDYAEFEELGWERPDPSTYTTFCKKCWPRGASPEDECDTASDPEVLQEDGEENDEKTPEKGHSSLD